MKVKFVGGIADGQIRNVRDGATELVVATFTPNAAYLPERSAFITSTMAEPVTKQTSYYLAYIAEDATAYFYVDNA